MDDTSKYYQAFNQHNIAYGVEQPAEGFWNSVTNSVSNIPKFTQAMIASTGIGFINTGAMVANIFKSEDAKLEYINTQKWLTEYDEDLGRYYRDNAAAVDTGGFIVGSLVPGMVGVRGLQAGQRALNMSQKASQTAKATGVFGSNVSRATGLLVPQTEAYVARAAEAIAKTNLKHKVLHAETLKALGSGLHQNILEAAAFESFAIASQAKSNFIDNMTAGELVQNALLGVGLGGALGGFISGVGIRRSIKKGVDSIDRQGIEGLIQSNQLNKASPDIQLTVGFNNKAAVESYIEQLESKIAVGGSREQTAIMERQLAAAQGTISDINNSIMENAIKLTTSKTVAKQFGKVLQDLPADQARNWLVGASKLSRLGEVRIRRTKGPQLELDLGTKVTASEIANEGYIWHKIWGEGADSLASTSERPAVAGLADNVKLGATQSMESALNREAQRLKFTRSDAMDVTSKNLRLRDVQARYWWAENQILTGKQTLGQYDIPLLEAALRDLDRLESLKVVNSKGETVFEGLQREAFQKFVEETKLEAALKLRRTNKPAEVIGEYTNIRSEYLKGTRVAKDQTDNLFANQYWAKQNNVTVKELLQQPRWMGVHIDKEVVSKLNPLELEADLFLAQHLKVHQESVDNAVAYAMAPYGQLELTLPGTGNTTANLNLFNFLPENRLLQEATTSLSRYGSGARLFSSANGNYNSPESIVQRIGMIKHEADKRGIQIVKESFDSVNRALKVDRKAAAELSAINELLAGKTDRFTVNPAGIVDAPEGTVMQLVPIKVVDNLVPADHPLRADVINISNPTTARAIETHIKLNGQRVSGRQALRESEGLTLNQDPRAFYPIKPDPRSTPFHAFVKDGTATGGTRTTMIHAATAKELDAMIQSIKSDFPQFHIITKGKGDDYFRALGEYDYSKTLNELDLDASLASRGINSQLLPVTDPDLVIDKFMSWHTRQVTSFNTDIIATKYAPEFATWTKLGREFAQLTESKFPDITAIAMHSKENPYAEYVKTALNISNISDYAKLTSANQAIDSAISQAWNSANNLFKRMKGVDQTVLDEINGVFDSVGYHTPFKSAEAFIAANHTADRAVLSKFIRNANSLLATVFLRMDALHSFNNKLGSILMTSTELRHVLNAAKQGDSEVAGKLVELSHIGMPGFKEKIFSPHKLMAEGYKNMFTRPDLRARAVAEGYVPSDISDAFRVIDNLSLRGNETPKMLQAKYQAALDAAKKVTDFGEKWTGNRWVEFTNRFVSYDVMRQLTDPLVEAGVITAKEAGTYINTFVGRTQVILNAAQRPMVFQGPVGMAMGLFQSYQFNLFQQLFRYIGDGAGRTVALMGGLQGSFYGLSGLPGFRWLNESIVGKAAGNLEHKDISSELTGALGNDMADFLIYGPLGKTLNTALHSRGDLTPHHPTILASSPYDLPAVKMYSRIFSNMYNAFGDLVDGVPLQQTLLTALEHNGLSRPLGGLAQVARALTDGDGQVKSTDSNRNFLAANDLWSLATLARLAGGKPLDEAKTREFAYRTNMYQRYDQERMSEATRALRTSMLGSGEVPAAQLDSLLELYVNTGRDLSRFNSFMLGQMERATVPETDRMISSLKLPYAVRMMQLMGGM